MSAWLGDLARDHVVIAALLYVAFRAAAVILSPVPGAVFDVPAVAVFGWPLALVLAECGIMIGAMTAFGIARVFRERVVRRFVTLQKVNDWERSLPKGDSFAAWVALRLPSNLAFDYISYAAGLTECSTVTFFWSTLIGNLPVMAAFFLLAGVGLNINLWLGWLLPLVFFILVTVISARYIRGQREKTTTSMVGDEPDDHALR